MTADRLIAEHVEAHRRCPGQWAGYPGICLICHLVTKLGRRDGLLSTTEGFLRDYMDGWDGDLLARAKQLLDYLEER